MYYIFRLFFFFFFFSYRGLLTQRTTLSSGLYSNVQEQVGQCLFLPSWLYVYMPRFLLLSLLSHRRSHAPTSLGTLMNHKSQPLVSKVGRCTVFTSAQTALFLVTCSLLS
ncbi:hypothetical protein EV127DRAFT_31411 [Xylaria flabelliformis]|nr:hypothetical protein EV127DRAFT_31411 [Xylaria flabelliformis]